MRAFEKYWNTLLYSHLEDGYQKTAIEVLLRDEWVALLKHIQDLYDPYETDSSNFLCIKDFIEKELGDK